MSAYDTGLDILGATGVARAAVSAIRRAGVDTGRASAISKHKKAAQRVIAAGQKIAKKRSKLGNAFLRVGNAHMKKADRATKMAKVLNARDIATVRALAKSAQAAKAITAPLPTKAPVAAAQQTVAAKVASSLARVSATTAKVASPISRAIAPPQMSTRMRTLVRGDGRKGVNVNPPLPPAPPTQTQNTSPPAGGFQTIPEDMMWRGEDMGPAPTPIETGDLDAIASLAEIVAEGGGMGALLDQLEKSGSKSALLDEGVGLNNNIVSALNAEAASVESLSKEGV